MDFRFYQMNVLRTQGTSQHVHAVLSPSQAGLSWQARTEVRGRGLVLEAPVYFKRGYDRQCWSGVDR